MYDSGLFPTGRSSKMGPKRDTLAELAKAIRGQGFALRGSAPHRAEHNFFYDGGAAPSALTSNDPKYAFPLTAPAHEWFMGTRQRARPSTTTGPLFSDCLDPRLAGPATTELVEKVQAPK